MTRSLSVLAVLALAGAANAEDYIHIESEFEPGSWSLVEPFWGYAPDGGETMSVSTDRFIGGNPPNSFMLSQFTMDIPLGEFNIAWAPVMINEFTYNPSVQGEITQFAASMTTLPAADNLPAHLGGPRMFIEQAGKLYSADPGPNFQAFHFDDPEQVRNFSGYTEDNFFEVIPQGGLDLASHPDFAGGQMEFGFGLSLVSTLLNGQGPVTVVGAFDNVSVRFSTVPSPGALALLGTGAVFATRRRRS
jgi:MYXO-CTERM domain-containing protein